MDKQQEKAMEQAADARLLSMNEQILFPLLDRNITQALASLCHEFKTSGTASLARVAYITACRDLCQELDSIARNGERAVVKMENYNKKS